MADFTVLLEDHEAGDLENLVTLKIRSRSPINCSIEEISNRNHIKVKS